MAEEIGVHRSGLTMPVVTPRFVDNAWRRGCDFINLDLEDSVPQHLKGYARTLIKDAIANVTKGGAEAFTRINHDLVQADLEGIVWPGLAKVNYPKAEYAEEIQKLDRIISRLERERGIRPGTVEIGANIETSVGVANAYSIASASPRVKEFGGAGGYDMSRNLGVEMFVGFDQFVYGKGEVELAARALGLEPHTAPFTANTTGSVGDPDRAFREAEAARKCGFRVGGGLHPNVVEPQTRGFTPTQEAVDESKQVLEQYRELEVSGETWSEINGRIIDRYEADRARRLLEWAQVCARRDQEKADAVARVEQAGG
ncbi:MAG: aldolase/citrate lyase family protein [Chloroflexi bacterium]|nr:aldolase/citrate lyase family protein [Chloroflexota bacterium]MDA1271064.1 aldolase/citrate lyase family protein [Chloroflexota bacterium]